MKLQSSDIKRINDLNQLYADLKSQELIAYSYFGGTIEHSIESLSIRYDQRFVRFEASDAYGKVSVDRVTLSAFDAREEFNYHMNNYRNAVKKALK